MYTIDEATEKWIQHEVELRLQSERFTLQDEKFYQSLKNQDEKFFQSLEHMDDKFSQSMANMDNKFSQSMTHMDDKFSRLYNQLNNKLNTILGLCGAIFTAILVPIILHSLKLV